MWTYTKKEKKKISIVFVIQDKYSEGLLIPFVEKPWLNADSNNFELSYQIKINITWKS